ncbi:MAG: EH signature domain-containing protein [Bacillota bacterium]
MISTLWAIPTFPPRRLADVTKSILKDIPPGPVDSLGKRAESVEFALLVERVRRTPANVIGDLAADLSLAEVDTLSYRFAEVEPNDAAKRRISTILLSRWKPRYARAAWRQYQSYFGDPELPRLIEEGLKRKQYPKFAGEAGERLSRIIRGANPVAEMARVIRTSGYMFVDCLAALDITDGSPLALELLRRYFREADDNTYLKVEKQDFLMRALKTLSKEYPRDHVVTIDNYLSGIDEGKHQAFIMEHILQVLGRPETHNPRWADMQQISKDRFMRWLSLKTISEFFARVGDNQRFEFWRQFSDAFVDARVIKVRDADAAFLVFGTIAVVEFARQGNAAYIYPRAFYDENLRDFAVRARPVYYESQLKTSGHIRRLIHSGAWQYNNYGDIYHLIHGSRG